MLYDCRSITSTNKVHSCQYMSVCDGCFNLQRGQHDGLSVLHRICSTCLCDLSSSVLYVSDSDCRKTCHLLFSFAFSVWYMNVCGIWMCLVYEYMIDGEEIEVVSSFTFLRSEVEKEGRCDKEIKRRVAIGKATMIGLEKLWQDKHVSIDTKKG